MKTVKLLVCLLCMLMGLSKAQAGHVAGGEIFWKSLNKDTLLVSINIYRDCSGSNIYNAPLVVTTTCGAKNYKTSVVVGREMLPLCDTACSKCDTPTRNCSYKIGLQKWTLNAVVPLADYRLKKCCELDFSWGLCCRNNYITTGAAQENFYLHAKLIACDSLTNDISWHDDLLANICLGKDMKSASFQMSSNTLGDSIVHRFIGPSQNATNRTSWNSPYGYDQPIYYLGFPKKTKKFPQGLHLNATSGLLQFRPMKEEVTTICVQAEIYRNGKRVAYSIRDQLVTVVKCTNNEPPIISGMDCTSRLSETEYFACAGEKIEFNICTSDKDKGDTVRLSLQNGIPGASFTILNKGSARETAHFSWTPKVENVKTAPYQFVVVAQDNACPVNAKGGQVFTIYVSKPKEVLIDTIDQNCGEYLFHAQGKNPIYFSHFDWKINSTNFAKVKTTPSLYDTVATKFERPGTYPLHLKAYENDRCAFLYNDSITIPNNFLWIEKPGYQKIGCPDDSTDLKLISHPAFGPPTVIWNSTDTTNVTTSIRRVPFESRISQAYYQVKEGSCLKSGSVFLVPFTKRYVSIPEQGEGCYGMDSFVLTPFSSMYAGRDSITSFKWTTPSHNLISTDSSITLKDSGFYLLKTTSIRGCNYIDTFYSYLKVPAFELPMDTAICQNDVAVFQASSKYQGGFIWNVSNSQKSYTRANQSTLQLVATERTKIVVQFNDQRGGFVCSIKDSFILDTLGLPNQFNVVHDNRACKDDSIKVTSASDSAIWTFQDQKYYGAKTQFPVLIDNQKEQPYPLFLTTISNKGCQSDTEMTVMLYLKPEVSFTVADSILAYKNYQPTNNSPWSANNFYQWTIGQPIFKTDSAFSPVFNLDTLGSFLITLTTTDTSTGCSQSYSDTLRVVHNINRSPFIATSAFVYPNPANNKVQIHWSNTPGFEIQLLDLQGRKLLQTTAVGDHLTLSTKSFETGTYLLLFQSQDHYVVRKLEVVQGN